MSCIRIYDDNNDNHDSSDNDDNGDNDSNDGYCGNNGYYDSDGNDSDNSDDWSNDYDQYLLIFKCLTKKREESSRKDNHNFFKKSYTKFRKIQKINKKIQD